MRLTVAAAAAAIAAIVGTAHAEIDPVRHPVMNAVASCYHKGDATKLVEGYALMHAHPILGAARMAAVAPDAICFRDRYISNRALRYQDQPTVGQAR